MSETKSRIFEGQVAAVTGAGKGLGKSYALWLGRQGCAVVVNNRTHPGVPSSAQAVVNEIVAAGGRAVAHEGAVDNAEEAAGITACALETFGRLDAFVCNAGIMPEGPFGEMSVETLTRLANINVLGTMFPLQAAWRHMLSTGYGRIVLTGSTVGTYGHPNVAAYGATRSAVIGLARSLTHERPEAADIGINVILPFAYTNMSAVSIDAGMGPNYADALSPDRIAPVLGWMCSRECRESGRIYRVTASRIARIGLVESETIIADVDDVLALSRHPFSLDPLAEPANCFG